MNDNQLLSKTIKGIQKANDYLTVSTLQVQDAINDCKLPQWLKTVLLWLSAWTLKKRGFFSFLKSYIVIGSAMLITRPSLWAALLKLLLNENSKAFRFLMAIVEFFDGAFDTIVFWGLTTVAILVVVFNFIIESRRVKMKRELANLIDEISFNPTEDWFDKKCNLAIKTLGDRYSSEVNFKNPQLSNVYKALINPEYWDMNFKKALQEFIKESKHLFESLTATVKQNNRDIETKTNGIVDIYNNRDFEQYETMFKYANDILDGFRTLMPKDVTLYGYKKIESAFKKIEDYDAICQFTSKPVLYVKGEAGMGKSHLLADIVKNRMSRKLKSLLALGLEFNEVGDVKERLMGIWKAKGTWDDFLNKLDKIGEIEKHRILIIIDGINEGLGNQLWPNELENIEADILQYKNLGLVISARTFSRTNILDKVANGKATITLEGFKGMEDEAITYLTGKFGVTLPNISRFKKEFSNPLFLKLYCQAYSNVANPLPSSFLDVVKNYLTKVNEKLAVKYGYQATLFNYTQKVSNAITELYRGQNSKWMVKYHKLDDLIVKAETILPADKAHEYVQDLVSEGVLMSYVNQKGEILVDFNFDLVGDYLYAEDLIVNGWHDYVGRVNSQGIYEATSVLLPLLKGVEIFGYNNTNINQAYREDLFVETLNQRFIISNSAIIEIGIIKNKDIDTYYEILPVLTSHPECNGIIASINSELKAMTMVERDQKWSMHFTIGCYDPSQTEMVKLAQWAASLSRKSTQTMTDEVSYQMACVLCWSFSSPYRLLRDIATKAVINLLMDKPNVLILIIDNFDDVNDPYIQQRVYAVAHGCTFRGDCCKSVSLGRKVYEKVFAVDAVRPDILLRDYARCTVDYISQQVELTGVDLNRIVPPYGVSFDISKCPDRATVEGKYRLDESMGYSHEVVLTQNRILHSMETEYSNGTCGYGDFGRYTFEASMYGWHENDEFNAPFLRNYALDLIFEKYKFDSSVYQRHDNNMRFSGGSRPVMERFGKKFQWIAMYEVLGLLQDNYPMEVSWLGNDKDIQCSGTWEPHVRDIDTTNAFANYYNEDHPAPREESIEWLHINTLPFIVKHEDEWLKSKEGMSKEIVKKTIEVKDEKGDSWMVLYGYNTMTQANSSLDIDESEAALWEFLQAYVVPRKRRDEIASCIAKKGTQGRDMPEYRNGIYELFYKDYYSSASYREYAKRSELDEWCDLEESGAPYQLSYRPYLCEAEMSAYRLSKQLFEMLELKDGERVGEYVDNTGRVIAFDPSISFQNDGQLVVRKEKLLGALKRNQMSLVWPILFEKQRGTSAIGCQFGGYAYLTDNGKIKVKLRLYQKRRDNSKRRMRNIMMQNYIELFWYTITFNKTKRVKTKLKIKFAQMYSEEANAKPF